MRALCPRTLSHAARAAQHAARWLRACARATLPSPTSRSVPSDFRPSRRARRRAASGEPLVSLALLRSCSPPVQCRGLCCVRRSPAFVSGSGLCLCGAGRKSIKRKSKRLPPASGPRKRLSLFVLSTIKKGCTCIYSHTAGHRVQRHSPTHSHSRQRAAHAERQRQHTANQTHTHSQQPSARFTINHYLEAAKCRMHDANGTGNGAVGAAGWRGEKVHCRASLTEPAQAATRQTPPRSTLQPFSLPQANASPLLLRAPMADGALTPTKLSPHTLAASLPGSPAPALSLGVPWEHDRLPWVPHTPPERSGVSPRARRCLMRAPHAAQPDTAQPPRSRRPPGLQPTTAVLTQDKARAAQCAAKASAASTLADLAACCSLCCKFCASTYERNERPFVFSITWAVCTGAGVDRGWCVQVLV